ncbi:DHH family phosphoesterase [Vibrio sp. CK2-1]|uniref:DHH family phosphoesterase n=1 Tax=Vibrio sp. CK2-1 TaxID=2912249 RepID=UPI001F36FB17|nr:DHH family phosphoesterase [Vibrio sp. CK2-1]MCF7355640.1 DHH family phosphoesterase [Vibrio sp. CK2-1]
MHYDVFNGDADGIIALLQLRLAEPKKGQLITGVKRDIQLLSQVVEKGDVTSVTVLDISLQKNITALNSLLEQQIPIFYCDHHQSGEIPQSPYLTSLINLDAETCTSLLISQHLKGQFQIWAIAGAFGDNMTKRAMALSRQSGLTSSQITFLKELGTLINYNGYGASLADLHITPTELFQTLLTYTNPFDLLDDTSSVFYQLKAGYEQDLALLKNIKATFSAEDYEVFLLPNAAWARRISGDFGNQLANQNPDKAFAVLTLNENQTDYTVSVRAPLNRREGADEVCNQFATGGGRRAAAGINALPIGLVDKFVEIMAKRFEC